MSATPLPLPRDREHQPPAAPLAMRLPLSRARHLPGYIYASPDILAAEQERIFKKHWLCVGRVEELPVVGDYLSLRIADQPIIVTRNAPDSLIALRNRCVHRGVEVVQGSGHAREFVCPYHAWTFDLSGKLTGAGYMKSAQWDRDSAALPRVRLELWRGWMFVNFDAAAAPLAAMMASYETPLWFYKSDATVLGDKFEVEVQTNWKFIVENLLDVYHVGTLHANTFGKFMRFLRDDFSFDAIAGGGLAFNFASKPMSADGSQSFPFLPWLKDDPGFAGKGNIFPNMNLSVRADSMRMWVMWPVAVDRTRIVSYLLVDKSAAAQPDHASKLEAYRNYMRSIVAEDQTAVESLQRNARADDFEPGPLSHLEGPIHHALNHYLDVMQL